MIASREPVLRQRLLRRSEPRRPVGYGIAPRTALSAAATASPSADLRDGCGSGTRGQEQRGEAARLSALVVPVLCRWCI
jgi:hypothetical protein